VVKGKMKKTRLMRVDESFYELAKESGKVGSRFTKDIVDYLKENEYKKKRKTNEWGFRI